MYKKINQAIAEKYDRTIPSNALPKLLSGIRITKEDLPALLPELTKFGIIKKKDQRTLER